MHCTFRNVNQFISIFQMNFMLSFINVHRNVRQLYHFIASINELLGNGLLFRLKLNYKKIENWMLSQLIVTGHLTHSMMYNWIKNKMFPNNILRQIWNWFSFLLNSEQFRNYNILKKRIKTVNKIRNRFEFLSSCCVYPSKLFTTNR